MNHMPTPGARRGVNSPVNSWSNIGRRAGSSEGCWDMGLRRKDTDGKKKKYPSKCKGV